jgi:uncharacterized protein YbjT (DUF2867 family)
MLTGPEALRLADQVRVLAELLGRNLRFEAQPDPEARIEMSKSMPAIVVDAFFGFFVDGEFGDSSILPAAHQITGAADISVMGACGPITFRLIPFTLGLVP